jgi:hypothetical protein
MQVDAAGGRGGDDLGGAARNGDPDRVEEGSGDDVDFDFDARRVRSMPSTTAVDSSSMDALAVDSPVRSAIMVWKLISASRRPWEISGWYGV